MLLMLCLATTKKLGHQVSCSLECKGLHSKIEYHKKSILPKYSVKIVQLPLPDSNEDLGALFLDPFKYGLDSEKQLCDFYKLVFDKNFNGDRANTSYQRFKNEVQVLFDLIHDQKHDKCGNHSAAYKQSRKHALLSENALITDIQAAFTNCQIAGAGRVTIAQDTIYTTGPEGLTLRSRVMDESVYRSADGTVKIVVGPRQSFSPGQPFENFKLATCVDDLNLSADFLIRAGLVSQAAGNQKDLELIVVGAPGITEADIRKKVDSIVQGTDYTAQLQSAAPKEINVATMGSMGLSAAYHYHTRQFIFTARSGLDHTWGKFCQTASKGTNPENNSGLGFGGYVGAGVDYKWAEYVAVGLEAGMRLNQLKIPMVKDPVQKATMWFSSPYAQVNCTFFGDDDTSLGLFSGYNFAKEFTVTSTGTRIPYGSTCKIGGLYGGLRLSKYF